MPTPHLDVSTLRDPPPLLLLGEHLSEYAHTGYLLSAHSVKPIIGCFYYAES